MPPVGCGLAAVAAIEVAIVRVCVALVSESAGLYAARIRDAVGPGVVAIDGDPL